MKYEEMSDFDINKLVAKLEFPEYKQITTDDNLGGESSTVIMSKPINGFGAESHYLNYCECPDNAWPIIVENKIGVQFFGDTWMSFVHNVASRHFCYDKNPLRAAMICFLKIKDAEL